MLSLTNNTELILPGLIFGIQIIALLLITFKRHEEEAVQIITYSITFSFLAAGFSLLPPIYVPFTFIIPLLVLIKTKAPMTFIVIGVAVTLIFSMNTFMRFMIAENYVSSQTKELIMNMSTLFTFIGVCLGIYWFYKYLKNPHLFKINKNEPKNKG